MIVLILLLRISLFFSSGKKTEMEKDCLAPDEIDHINLHRSFCGSIH
jgi:hypothetical protein